MKYVLLGLAVFALLWLLRRSWRQARRPPAAPARVLPPQPMVTCLYCGVHLPRDEALPAPSGVFCDAAHRAAFERAQPDR